ncbi:unnamed protein product [Rotaria sp. Silwood2]|nr:unnamed protein product [Rotaria sp. Silwood2]CAF3276428.1 unnamed protein product [Rotaria sp. Silwood2]CAF4550119.1 unnamed protein product [Rotaria sp. Silwood2]
MDAKSVSYQTNSATAYLNPIIVFPPEKDPSCYKKFVQSKNFKYIKIIFFVIILINMNVWGGMLLFISVGAADKTMPDEQTRKMWMEIDFQIINGLISIIIIGLTPWRIRDLYQLYQQKYRDELLRRHKYTNNFIWIQIIIWSSIVNSMFQVGVAICTWSTNMDNRPTRLVGILGGISLIAGVFAAVAQFILGRKTKKKEKMEQKFNNIV